MNTSSLIVIVCVAIPAVIAISVCAVIYCSRRSKTQKSRRQENSSYDSYEHRSQDDYPRTYPYGQQGRLHEPSPVFEQSPPFYNPQIRRQLFPPVARTNVHLTPISLTPSVHRASPPSYHELFLTPHRLTNR